MVGNGSAFGLRRLHPGASAVALVDVRRARAVRLGPAGARRRLLGRTSRDVGRPLDRPSWQPRSSWRWWPWPGRPWPGRSWPHPRRWSPSPAWPPAGVACRPHPGSSGGGTLLGRRPRPRPLGRPRRRTAVVEVVWAGVSPMVTFAGRLLAGVAFVAVAFVVGAFVAVAFAGLAFAAPAFAGVAVTAVFVPEPALLAGACLAPAGLGLAVDRRAPASSAPPSGPASPPSRRGLSSLPPSASRGWPPPSWRPAAPPRR